MSPKAESIKNSMVEDPWFEFWGEVGPGWKYFYKLNHIFQLQTTVFCYQAVGNAVVGA